MCHCKTAMIKHLLHWQIVQRLNLEHVNAMAFASLVSWAWFNCDPGNQTKAPSWIWPPLESANWTKQHVQRVVCSVDTREILRGSQAWRSQRAAVGPPNGRGRLSIKKQESTLLVVNDSDHVSETITASIGFELLTNHHWRNRNSCDRQPCQIIRFEAVHHYLAMLDPRLKQSIIAILVRLEKRIGCGAPPLTVALMHVRNVSLRMDDSRSATQGLWQITVLYQHVALEKLLNT